MTVSESVAQRGVGFWGWVFWGGRLPSTPGRPAPSVMTLVPFCVKVFL